MAYIHQQKTVRQRENGPAITSLDINQSALVDQVSSPSTDYQNRTITYYFSLTLNGENNGDGYVVVEAFSPNTPKVSVQISTSPSFNQTTGWPSSGVVASGWEWVSGTSAVKIIETNNLNLQTYYFWFRNDDSDVADIRIQVRYLPKKIWKIVWGPTTLPTPLTTVYTPPQPISPVEQYTIYHYAAKFERTGSVRFESLSSISNVRLTVTQGSYTLNDQTGRISCSDIYESYDSVTFNVTQAGIWYDFFLRHETGSRTDDLNFRITPPGELWDVVLFDTKTVGDSGYSWTANSDWYDTVDFEKKIHYIKLNFNPIGDYRFDLISNQSYNMYLTSSTNIDSDGVPTDILGSCSTPYNPYFRYTPVSPSRTYYLMFRSASGQSQDGRLELSIGNYQEIIYWNLVEETISNPLTKQLEITHNFNYDIGFEVCKKTIKFSQSGAISFYSMPNTNPVDDIVYPIGWITLHTDRFDRANGSPDSNDVINNAHDGGNNRQFSITYSVSANTWYDFWFRLPTGTQIGIGHVIIDVPGGGGPSGTWSYERDTSADREGQTVSFTESVTLISRPDISSPAKGEYFRVRFGVTGSVEISIPDSPPAILYVQSNSINADRGFDSGTGAPYYAMAGSGSTSLTINVTNTNTYYFIWVRGATTTVSGSTTVTVKMIQWQVSTSYSPPNPIYVDWNPTPAALSEGTVYKIALRFAYSGEAKFFSDDGHTRLAWLTATAENGDITPSTGIPILPSGGSFLAKDDDEGGNFEFKYTVAAGTTYYFWIRSNNFNDTTTLSLHIDAPGSTDTTKGFWLYDGSKYVKVKVFICTSINPVVWTRVKHPCICTSINPNTIWLEGT